MKMTNPTTNSTTATTTATTASTNQPTGKTIVISERDNIAALVEDGKAVEFFVHRGDMLLGDVYLATVENILPSIDAAFVNLGADRMGFLHASDVPGKGELKERLQPKQKILVQIMKEPTGHKGPRVTTALSIPGRFLVLMPEEKGISISRKILSPKERGRLKSIVSLFKPAGVGIIIRTEAENQSEEEIKEDLETLLEKWQNIVTTTDTVSPPSLIHRDQDLLYRVIRESCTDDVGEIFIDTPFGQHRVNQLIQTWNLGKNIKVTVYKGNDSLLIAKGIDKEIKMALNTKVNLPSGGYLYIQPTEALTVIDVNSGRFTSSQTQGETIRHTNLEAVSEIARQLRLRNIGGMIVIDFIDMDNRVDQLAILEAFEMALMPDKAKPQVGQISDLGLVELTRHRQGQSLSEIFTKKCPACSGSGTVIEDLNFAPASLEGEMRARIVKSKMVPRLKQNNNSPQQQKPQHSQHTQQQMPTKNKQESNLPIKTRPESHTEHHQPVTSKPHSHFQTSHHNQQSPQHAQQNPSSQPQPKPQSPSQPQHQQKPTTNIQIATQFVSVPSKTKTIYVKSDNPENLTELTIDKLRKVYEESDKKYYPEISKIVRFSGMPINTAKEFQKDSPLEDKNVIDVFSVLQEMEVAFSQIPPAIKEPPKPAEPEFKPHKPEPKPQEQTKKLFKQPEVAEVAEVDEPEVIPVVEEELDVPQFKGIYGVASDGEDFEDLYEVMDADEAPSPENVSDKIPEQSVEVEDDSEDSDETSESENSESSDSSDKTGAKTKRTRKTSKTPSARKKPSRGRPKTK